MKRRKKPKKLGRPSAEKGEEFVIGGEGRDKGPKTQKDRAPSYFTIDGFCVQCQISEIYSDPIMAADKASSVLSILGSEPNLRDCENSAHGAI